MEYVNWYENNHEGDWQKAKQVNQQRSVEVSKIVQQKQKKRLQNIAYRFSGYSFSIELSFKRKRFRIEVLPTNKLDRLYYSSRFPVRAVLLKHFKCNNSAPFGLIGHRMNRMIKLIYFKIISEFYSL